MSKISKNISKNPKRNLKIFKTLKIVQKILKILGKIPKISKIFKKILYDLNLCHFFGTYLPPGPVKIRHPDPICPGLTIEF